MPNRKLEAYITKQRGSFHRGSPGERHIARDGRPHRRTGRLDRQRRVILTVVVAQRRGMVGLLVALVVAAEHVRQTEHS